MGPENLPHLLLPKEVNSKDHGGRVCSNEDMVNCSGSWPKVWGAI